ncbi:MAG TPA: hypothetical protein VGC93_08815 [Thermoanaerobaculia bacterium]
MRGVSSLQEKWLDQQKRDDIAVFVVWSDQLFAGARHVPEAAELMPDRRARHYWDGDRVLGRAYQDRLEAGGRRFELDREAWDVWLLFDRDARWGEGGPPQPSWWEHQLRGPLPPERRLDPERFAARAAQLLARPRPPR